MNFNEEMAREFDAVGIEYEIIAIPPEKRATPEEWQQLENKIAAHAEENYQMMALSGLYATNFVD